MRNNKMVMVLAIIMGILIIAVMAGIIFVTIDKSKNASRKIIVDASSNSEEAIRAEKEEKLKAFNGKFTSYLGEQVSATLVKSLLSEIILSNNQNEERQLVVKILDTEIEEGTNDTEKLANIQKTIENEYTYSVECNYEDETGYVYEIIIKKSTSANVLPEIQAFNQKFEQYKEQIVKGTFIKEEIAKIINTSNSKNEGHKIMMYSGELKSLGDIKDDADYKITLSYDEQGYIYRIDADEQSGNLRNVVNDSANMINEGNRREHETVNEMEDMMNNILQQYNR